MPKATRTRWESVPGGTVRTADTHQVVADLYARGLGDWRSRAQMEEEGRLIARAESALDRLLSAMGIRRIPLEEALARLEEAIGRAGTTSIHDLSTDTRRPTMDLDALIARWRRLAGHTRINPGALTPADVYELCADELEARINTHALQQREQEAVQA